MGWYLPLLLYTLGRIEIRPKKRTDKTFFAEENIQEFFKSHEQYWFTGKTFEMTVFYGRRKRIKKRVSARQFVPSRLSFSARFTYNELLITFMQRWLYEQIIPLFCSSWKNRLGKLHSLVKTWQKILSAFFHLLILCPSALYVPKRTIPIFWVSLWSFTTYTTPSPSARLVDESIGVSWVVKVVTRGEKAELSPEWKFTSLQDGKNVYLRP